VFSHSMALFIRNVFLFIRAGAHVDENYQSWIKECVIRGSLGGDLAKHRANESTSL
jgi:hypothetical protein